MKIDIVTLFPNMFSGPFDESIIKRARDYGVVDLEIHQLRDWAKDKHQVVDARPYGGGVGMVMMIEPIYNALTDLKAKGNGKAKTILLDAGGTKFTQKHAQSLSKEEHLILLCGHYEGIDHRVEEHLIDEVYSIGDFVLTGGEIPAMLITDAVARLLPGVLEKDGATDLESFTLPSTDGNSMLLEYPQYTRPEEFNGWTVPEVLLSGHHGEIDKWRQAKAQEKTKMVRPDLLTDK